MKNSYYAQNIYGTVLENFSGGNLQSEGVVSTRDIAILSGKLVDALYKQKTTIIMDNFKTADTLVLDFDPLISTQIKAIQVKNVPGEKTPLLK